MVTVLDADCLLPKEYLQGIDWVWTRPPLRKLSNRGPGHQPPPQISWHLYNLRSVASPAGGCIPNKAVPNYLDRSPILAV